MNFYELSSEKYVKTAIYCTILQTRGDRGQFGPVGGQVNKPREECYLKIPKIGIVLFL